jgi:hypothetical protein
MGCGSIIYKVVKIVVIAVANYFFPVVGGMVASAMFTLIEGGSFKEALVSAAISGVASYAGAQVGAAVSSAGNAMGASLSEGAANAAMAAGGPMGDFASAAGTSVFSDAVATAGGAVAGTALETGTPFVPGLDPTHPLYQDPTLSTFSNTFTDAAGNVTANPYAAVDSLGQPLISEGVQGTAAAMGQETGILSALDDPLPEGIGQGVKSFSEAIDGPITRAVAAGGKSLANTYNDLVSLPLLNVLPKFAARIPPKTWADLVGLGAEGMTSFTVGQALDAQLEGLGPALESEGGFPTGAFAELSEIHRRTQIAIRFNEIIEETDNPFITPEMEQAAFDQAEKEFNAVIAGGLDRRNQELGANITQEQFDASFNVPDLGPTLLANEQAARQRDYGETLNQAFPGDAFQDIDDDIISSIVDERQAGPSSIISNVQARGTLNPLGGQTATKFLESQVPEATAKVGQAAQGIGAGYQQDLFDIRDRAQSEIGEYKLGDPLFDVEPFAQERGDLLAEQQGTFPSDIRAATTDVPLFDINAAINRAGSRQGLVSGTPAQAPLLDTLAAREAAAKRSDRGASSTGSGTF